MQVRSEVLLLRHAPTGWNAQRRRQGWSDQPLTSAGLEAAQSWARRPPARFETVVASDLARARDTAQVIAAALGLSPVIELAGLREQHQGAWTGLTKEQIKDQWPERMREHPRRPVGGEPAEAVLERVLAALGRVVAEYGGQKLLGITHSGVIRTLEWAIEADAPPVPHLEGRWFHVAVGGEAPSVIAGPCTAGRLSLGIAEHEISKRS